MSIGHGTRDALLPRVGRLHFSRSGTSNFTDADAADIKEQRVIEYRRERGSLHLERNIYFAFRRRCMHGEWFFIWDTFSSAFLLTCIPFRSA